MRDDIRLLRKYVGETCPACAADMLQPPARFDPVDALVCPGCDSKLTLEELAAFKVAERQQRGSWWKRLLARIAGN